MMTIVYLLALPFAEDAKGLTSDRFAVRERSINRLERYWPLSEPAIRLCAVRSDPTARELLGRQAKREWHARLWYEVDCFVAITSGKGEDDFDPKWLQRDHDFFYWMSTSAIGGQLWAEFVRAPNVHPFITVYRGFGLPKTSLEEAKRYTLVQYRSMYRGWAIETTETGGPAWKFVGRKDLSHE